MSLWSSSSKHTTATQHHHTTSTHTHHTTATQNHHTTAMLQHMYVYNRDSISYIIQTMYYKSIKVSWFEGNTYLHACKHVHMYVYIRYAISYIITIVLLSALSANPRFHMGIGTARLGAASSFCGVFASRK